MFEKAEWIWDKTEKVNGFLETEKSFIFGGGNAALRISCESDYAVYINDELLFCGQYFSYEDYKIYDEFDLSALLSSGNNTVKIVAHHAGEGCFTYKNCIAGLIYEIVSGDNVLCCSSAGDMMSVPAEYVPAPYDVSPQLGKSVNFDFTATKNDCFAAVAVNKDKILYPRPLERCVLGEKSGGTIVAQGIYEDDPSQVFPSDRLQNAKLASRDLYPMTGMNSDKTLPGEIEFFQGDDVYVVIDLGKEAVGYLYFDIETKTDTEILMGYGEHLDDLRPRCSINGRNFAFSYKVKSGRTNFFQPFKRVAARYLMLVVKGGGFILRDSGVREYVYPLRKKAVTVSDRLHARIDDMCLETLGKCVHEHYEDSPWRQQALLGKDFYNQMLCGFYCFDKEEVAKVTKSSLELIIRSTIDKDGMFDIAAPCESPIRIPSYALWSVMAAVDYYRFTGDEEFTRCRVISAVNRVIDGFIARLDKKTGLIVGFNEPEYWNFYEWRKGLDGGDIFRTKKIGRQYELPINALFVLALRAVAGMMKPFGLSEAAKYEELADNVKSAVEKYFYDEKAKAYYTRLVNGKKESFHEYSQCLMLLCGCDHTDEAVKSIKRERFIKVTLPDLFVKYEALMQYDENNAECILEDIERIYTKMLCVPNPTAWETDEGGWEYGNAESRCHGWSCAPAWFYRKYIVKS